MSEPDGVVGRVARLLRAVSQSPSDGATTTQVARAASLPRASAHRLLESLTAEGLVDRDQRSGRWFLGPELYVLGVAAAPRYDLTSEARESVHRLCQATGESAFFSVRRGDETVCLVREDGSFPIRSFVLFEGSRFPLGVVSAGIVVLAYLPDAEIDAYLEAVDLTDRWGASHSGDEIRRRVAETREHGWSVNPGLVVEGSWGMAAAIFDAQGRPHAALSLNGVESRFRPERQDEMGRLLLDEAHALSAAGRSGVRRR
ncbi:IclR family transcriptional regulator [Mumia sp. DW29H23]|uniref:IclR family transcriptional regulator n=1 Tax=Mumia sp. DW29H23 TaxID=3421241 RepID=UPI003D684717